MQLNWETVKTVASVPIIDFWYLVPTGLAINRLVTRDGKMPEAWSNKLDSFLGTTDWRTRWYKPSLQQDLFGVSGALEKAVGVDDIEADFQQRLKDAFALVASNRLQLKDRGRVLFTLMFACSNPSPNAHRLAVRIANHLLKG
jgi:three-Cys-motif partner protein